MSVDNPEKNNLKSVCSNGFSQVKRISRLQPQNKSTQQNTRKDIFFMVFYLDC